MDINKEFVSKELRKSYGYTIEIGAIVSSDSKGGHGVHTCLDYDRGRFYEVSLNEENYKSSEDLDIIRSGTLSTSMTIKSNKDADLVGESIRRVNTYIDKNGTSSIAEKTLKELENLYVDFSGSEKLLSTVLNKSQLLLERN